MYLTYYFSKSFTEWYNPTTGQFEMGPAMPVNSVHGLCTALAPSGLIYMFARREPGMTRAFTFDPASKTFTEIASLNVEKRYSACAVVSNPAGRGEDFVVIGGGA